jgi:hypothetical protein
MSAVNETPETSAITCIRCGRANPPGLRACPHCGTALAAVRKRRRGRLLFISLLRILGLTAILLFLGYTSLITTSDPINPRQQKQVDSAIDVIERSGFEKEAFVLRRLVRYRSTDNWWNRYLGHQSAYAATNFPFQVVTLYPQFFSDPVDDVERAAILLHESYHLFGYGEPRAFEGAWKDRHKLGWVKSEYELTPVWMSVKVTTMRWAPQLFTCGENRLSDCTEPD